MSRRSVNSSRGFSLVELLVALAVGTIVVGAAVKLFSQGMAATFVVSQRAEMQQDLRGSSDLLFKDLSLAGAGLPSATGILLPSQAGKPIYGYAASCAAKNNCIPGNGVAYPCAKFAGVPCNPTLYGLIPGYQLGITVPGSPNPSDLVTVVYSDIVFALPCYTIQKITPTAMTVQLPAPLPATCILTPPLLAPQAVNAPAVGLVPGDVVLVQSTVAGNSAVVVAEVTNVAANGAGNYTVTFAAGDTLNMNQPAALAADLAQLACAPAPAVPCPPTATSTRIFVVSYYLWMMPDPLGVGAGTPTLMRQVNGQTPVPVQEGVVNLQFTYDTYDINGNLLNAVGDGGYSTGTSFNLIRKINVLHLTTRSQVSGVRSSMAVTNGYQTFDTHTSISGRNLSYQNRYVLQ